jgi:hypothetical protein
MKVIKYQGNEYLFPETIAESIADIATGHYAILHENPHRNELTLQLFGLHTGPPIIVQVCGIELECDCDEDGSVYSYYSYAGLDWPDNTPLDDEGMQWIGDFYETEILDAITPD